MHGNATSTADERSVQSELQSGHDNTMALRLAEYALTIYRLPRKNFPREIVLYVGEAPRKMDQTLLGPDAKRPLS